MRGKLRSITKSKKINLKQFGTYSAILLVGGATIALGVFFNSGKDTTVDSEASTLAPVPDCAYDDGLCTKVERTSTLSNILESANKLCVPIQDTSTSIWECKSLPYTEDGCRWNSSICEEGILRGVNSDNQDQFKINFNYPEATIDHKIFIYKKDATSTTEKIDWKWLNNTQTQPTVAVKKGFVTFDNSFMGNAYERNVEQFKIVLHTAGDFDSVVDTLELPSKTYFNNVRIGTGECIKVNNECKVINKSLGCTFCNNICQTQEQRFGYSSGGGTDIRIGGGCVWIGGAKGSGSELICSGSQTRSVAYRSCQEDIGIGGRELTHWGESCTQIRDTCVSTEGVCKYNDGECIEVLPTTAKGDLTIPDGKQCTRKNGTCVVENTSCNWCGNVCAKYAPSVIAKCDSSMAPVDQQCQDNGNSGCEITTTDNQILITPTDSDFFADSIDVVIKLKVPKEGTAIYYRTQGGAEYIQYTNAITISATTTIEARVEGWGGDQQLLASKTYTKKILGSPENLSHTCQPSGAQVQLKWDKVSGANGYIVSVYTEADKLLRSVLTEKDTITFSNIQAEHNYPKWEVQALIKNDDTAATIDMTKYAKTESGSFTCIPTAPGVPTVVGMPTITNLFKLRTNGTKPAGSSLSINDVQVIGATSSTEWAYEFDLKIEGKNSFELKTNNNGKESAKVVINITRCKFADINCDGKINIVDFSWYVKAFQIQLYTPEKHFDYMDLADMNNGEGARGDGKIDIRDFDKFRKAYVKAQ